MNVQLYKKSNKILVLFSRFLKSALAIKVDIYEYNNIQYILIA